MKIGSLFAGIGGFDLGFERAGFTTAWQVEIDPQARSVLAKRFPVATRHDDIRAVGAAELEPVDIICGGFPCQDLSVAGKRAGLAGKRSGLFFEMLRIVDELTPRFLVWENVPGLLSSENGRDFETVLAALGEHGYFGACRILDARWFGVAQRRRRIFGVFARGDSGAERGAEILALADGLRGDSPPRREAGAGIARSITSSAGGASGKEQAMTFVSGNDPLNALDGVCGAVSSKWSKGTGGPSGDECQNLVAVGQCHGSNVGEFGALRRGNGNATGGVPFVAQTITSEMYRSGGATAGNNPGVRNVILDVAHALRAEVHDASEDGTGRGVPLCVSIRGRDGGGTAELGGSEANALRASSGGGDKPHVLSALSVRRLTPRECERLQGFPDDWTRIGIVDGREKILADGPRYRMLGNAVAVPCAYWIARRMRACV